MTVETFTYVTSLTAANPGASDPKSEGDDHLRGIKTVLLNSFPNVAGAVSATHTQLGYVTGVTSAIQTQLDAKAPIASPTFTGVPAVPTAAPGTNTTQAASTAFVGVAVAAGTTSALTLIQAQTAAASATIDFTTSIDGTYEEYELHIINAVPATDLAIPWIRTSANAGTSWASTAADYAVTVAGFSGTATVARQGQVSETAIPLTGQGTKNTASLGGVSAVVRIFDPSATSSNKQLVGSINNAYSATTTNLETLTLAASRLSASAVNGLRFMFSTGNIASGKFKLYGVKK